MELPEGSAPSTPPPSRRRRLRAVACKRLLWQRTRWQSLQEGDEAVAVVKSESEEGEKVFTAAEVQELLRTRVKEIVLAVEVKWQEKWQQKKKPEVEKRLEEEWQEKWQQKVAELEATAKKKAELEKRLEEGRRRYDLALDRVKELEEEVAALESHGSDSEAEGEAEPFCALCGVERLGSDCEASADNEEEGSCAPKDSEYGCYGDCGSWAHLACIQAGKGKFTKRGFCYESGWVENGPGIFCPECCPRRG